MKQGTKIKNYCNECHHETWHNVLFVQTKSESNYEMSWYQDYGILQCAGCDTICFRVDSSDSESYENDEFGNWIPIVTQENYPPSNEGFGIIENIYEIPNEIRDIYNETVKYYKSFKWCIFLIQGEYIMATNGILLGQNNNEESLKKEVFFISDPITLNMNPANSHSESSFSTLTLPTEEMKKYSYINFGIYDGNCSTKITGYRSGQSYMYIFFRLNSKDFYIYSRNIGSGAVKPEKYEDSFTFFIPFALKYLPNSESTDKSR